MPRKPRQPAPPALHADSYWHRAQQPLSSLFMLLPLIVLYELGVLLYATDPAAGAVTRDIYARWLLRDFLEAIGLVGYYLPAAIVVVMLLAMQLVRPEPWRFDLELYLVMILEAVILAAPLFVIIGVLGQKLSLAAASGAEAGAGWQSQLVFSLGAGIYEELLFRAVAMALLGLLFEEVLSLPREWAVAATVALSSILFALYHFPGAFTLDLDLFREHFNAVRLVLYTVGGVYLGMVYLWRGFGIVAGTHAMYDVYVTVFALAHAA